MKHKTQNTKHKTQNTKLLTKLCLLLLTLTLLNCEKETVDVTTEVQQENKISNISFNRFKTLVNAKSLIKLEKIFSPSNSNERTTSSNPTVLKDDIVRVQFEDYATYTFKIVAETEADEFYNLVLHVNDQQEVTKSNILKYTPSESWLSDPTTYFSGNVAVMDNNFFDVSSLTDVLRNDSCVTGVSTEWECSVGAPHSPDFPNCGGTSWTFWIEIETGSCGGGSNSGNGGNFDPFGGNPGNTGGPGGTGGNPGGGDPNGDPNNIETSPSVVGDIDIFLEKARAVALVLGIQEGTLEYAWLTNYNENEDKVDEIADFINENTDTESISLANQIVEAGKNNVLVSAFPFVKYPNNSNYSTLYPKLTEYLKNQLPNIKNNTTITNAIKTYTNLTTAQIQKHLKWGEGPTIKIEQIGSAYGKFRKSNDPDSIYLDIDLVNQLENTTPNSNLANAFAFLIGVTVLHEYVHYGDYNYNGDTWIYPQEEGLLFENDVYGQSVWIHNAEIILKNN